MKTYYVTLKREKYVRFTIKADSQKEAIEKAFNEDYNEEDILEDEYMLPSSDWLLEDIEEKDDKQN